MKHGTRYAGKMRAIEGGGETTQAPAVRIDENGALHPRGHLYVYGRTKPSKKSGAKWIKVTP